LPESLNHSGLRRPAQLDQPAWRSCCAPGLRERHRPRRSHGPALIGRRGPGPLDLKGSGLVLLAVVTAGATVPAAGSSRLESCACWWRRGACGQAAAAVGAQMALADSAGGARAHGPESGDAALPYRHATAHFGGGPLKAQEFALADHRRPHRVCGCWRSLPRCSCGAGLNHRLVGLDARHASRKTPGLGRGLEAARAGGARLGPGRQGLLLWKRNAAEAEAAVRGRGRMGVLLAIAVLPAKWPSWCAAAGTAATGPAGRVGGWRLRHPTGSSARYGRHRQLI